MKEPCVEHGPRVLLYRRGLDSTQRDAIDGATRAMLADLRRKPPDPLHELRPWPIAADLVVTYRLPKEDDRKPCCGRKACLWLDDIRVGR